MSSIFIQPAIDTLKSISLVYKQKALATSILSIITYTLHEDSIALVTLLAFILIDSATGIWASIKNNPGSFTSRKFRKTVIKVAIYFMLIGLFHSLEKVNSIFSTLELDTGVMSWLAITEILSIMENVNKIRKMNWPQWLTDVLEKMKNEKIK